MSSALSVAGVIAASLLAAGAVLLGPARWRALAMLGAAGLVPVLLLAHIWDTPQLEDLRDRPALALAGAGVALLGLVLLAVLFARRPAALALAAVAALPFRVPVEAGGSTANLLVPLYVVIGAGALAWAAPRLRGDDAPRRSAGALEWLLAASVVLYALQSAYSPDIDKALEQTVFFFVPFMLLFVALRDVGWTPRLLHACLGALVVLALVFVGIGFWEYSARELLLNPKVIASNQFEEYFRVNSLFFDPNIYGRFLAVVMLLVTAVLLWTRDQRLALGAAVVLAVLWGGLLLTLSQSSFAALLAGLAVLALLRFRARWTLGALGLGLVAAAVLVLAFPSAVGFKVSDRESLDDATSGRLDLLEGGLELARDRPVQGWGAGGFEREFRRQEKASSRRATSASHTIPVTVAAEQGVIGLAVYIALVAAALVRLLRGAKGVPARAAIAAAFVAVVVHTWMYAAFLEDPVTWALLGAGVALAATAPRAAAAPPGAYVAVRA